MEIYKINTNFYTNRNKNIRRNVNFGLKIDQSAEEVFFNIAKHFDTDSATFKIFSNKMSKVRNTLKNAGIIQKKGGTGLCVSVPVVVKSCPSKTDVVDTLVEYLKKPTDDVIDKLLKDLKTLEKEYLKKTKHYKAIHGRSFVPPEEFFEKRLVAL